MSIILIVLGLIIRSALAKSQPDSEHYFEYASRFMINPLVRLILNILSWGLIIYGIIFLFS